MNTYRVLIGYLLCVLTGYFELLTQLVFLSWAFTLYDLYSIDVRNASYKDTYAKHHTHKIMTWYISYIYLLDDTLGKVFISYNKMNTEIVPSWRWQTSWCTYLQVVPKFVWFLKYHQAYTGL